MKILFASVILACAWAAGQNAAPPAEQEERDLESALREAGSSPIEYARALENHLKKYPDSPKRAEIQRVLVRAAIDSRDKRRLIEFGVPLLDAGTQDTQMLEHVTRALVEQSDKESLERALRYAKRLEELARGELADLSKDKEYHPGLAHKTTDLDVLTGRALSFQARALGGLGQKTEAAKAAIRSYEAYASAEAAREAAKWLEADGKPDSAVHYLAEALMIADPRTSEALRRADRAKLGELWIKLKGSEAGLGDVVLAALDHTTQLITERERKLKEIDPNYGASQPSEFVLSALQGAPLPLSTLKGKVTVVDFWATWCEPCRAQYPLYQKVKQRFQGQPEVVFLAVSTDEDRSVVAPFLKSVQWSKQVYFDDGLAAYLRVSSIPTTVILGHNGAVVSRLNGYIAERFVDMLSARIEDALAAR
jgi:thiol-disulfide isomerase/thioredoxin